MRTTQVGLSFCKSNTTLFFSSSPDWYQYDGTMSHEARAKALQDFGEQKNIKVLVASLKCGGVGLNLTMASKVISIDLWWNSAIEQQGEVQKFTSLHAGAESCCSILPGLSSWANGRDLHHAFCG